MKKRVTDRAVLRALKHTGVDVEGIRSAIAATSSRPLITCEIDETGLLQGDGHLVHERRVRVPAWAVFIGVKKQ